MCCHCDQKPVNQYCIYVYCMLCMLQVFYVLFLFFFPHLDLWWWDDLFVKVKSQSKRKSTVRLQWNGMYLNYFLVQTSIKNIRFSFFLFSFLQTYTRAEIFTVFFKKFHLCECKFKKKKDKAVILLCNSKWCLMEKNNNFCPISNTRIWKCYSLIKTT